MILPLRSRHRAMMVVLAVIVPVVFGAGLVARRAIPRIDGSSALLAVPTARDALRVDRRLSGSTDSFAVQVTRERVPEQPGKLRLLVQVIADTGHPELLVYWTEDTAAGGPVPDGARLLGAVAGSTPVSMVLGGAESGRDGALLFYSLTQHERVHTMSLPGVTP